MALLLALSALAPASCSSVATGDAVLQCNSYGVFVNRSANAAKARECFLVDCAIAHTTPPHSPFPRNPFGLFGEEEEPQASSTRACSAQIMGCYCAVMRRNAIVFVALAAVLSTGLAAPGSNNGFDHRAHAVPGGPYSVKDTAGKGTASVKLDGELSHSHYFNPANGQTGKIVSFQWLVGQKQICGQMSCTAQFKLGTTAVKLVVKDNSGAKDETTTMVSVESAWTPNARVWFYPNVGSISASRNSKPLPTYSEDKPRIAFNGKGSFPSFVGQKFSVRVHANIYFKQAGMYEFQVACGGGACLLKIGGAGIVSGRKPVMQSKKRFYAAKKTATFEATFSRSQSKGPSPKFVVSWRTPGSKNWVVIPSFALSHSPGFLRPVLHYLRPKEAEVGSVITLIGTSFVDVVKVTMGKSLCAGVEAINQWTIKCVVPGEIGTQKVTVFTKAGRSNTVPFTITNSGGAVSGGVGRVGYYQPIKFRTTFLKTPKGGTFKASQMTSITTGPDGRYYIGSLNGFVHVLTVDLGNVVRGYCKSDSVGPNRSILGVGFNPAQYPAIKLYASTSVLYWGVKKILPFQKGWNNGEIVVMTPGGKSKCMTKSSTAISGLPVSNHDHSVNGISFDQTGALLVTVGGGNNAGVSKPGDKLGGVENSPFSGAMLGAPVLKRNFKGKVTYNQYKNPATAVKTGGDVFLYASGIRNSFSHIVHSNGRVYANDNGANTGFGDMSTGCNSEGRLEGEPDTLKMVIQNGFHGYANRNRGRFDPRQCTHRPPQKNKSGYIRHIATYESSTNGLQEVTSNVFGAQMRGDLLATKFAVGGKGKVYRMQLTGDGKVKSKTELVSHSGLSAATSPVGGLVMPRVYQGTVAVLEPVEVNPKILVVTSVTPHRGPKRGGNRVTVTGWNLAPPLKATVGGKPCGNIGNFAKNGRSFQCNVPAGAGKVPVAVTRLGKKSTSYGWEYIYMSV